MIFDESGDLHIMSAAADLPTTDEALSILADELQRDLLTDRSVRSPAQTPEVIIERVEWSFPTLAAGFAMVNDEVFQLREVHSLDIDEVLNRVTISIDVATNLAERAERFPCVLFLSRSIRQADAGAHVNALAT